METKPNLVFLRPINADNLHLRSEQIRLRLRNYPSMIGGQAMVLVILDLIMWDVLPHAALLMYNAAWMLVSSIESTWWWRNRDRIHTVHECTRWHIAFIVFTGFLALFWGGMSFWLFPADLIHQMLMLMLLLGMAGASVSTNTVYLLSFYIWIVGVMVPPILRFASVGDEAHWAIAGFATLYFAVLIKAGGEVGDAFLDALNNRRAFYEIAGPVWSTGLRNNRDVSVILLDIDHFKVLNDNYGHSFGDKVLESVASILAVSAREGDVVARWGGEEFILLLPETNLEAAMALAERLRVLISEMRIECGQTSLSITASFGVVQRADPCLTVDELTSCADKCLYQAKSEGRNRVCDRLTATPNKV